MDIHNVTEPTTREENKELNTLLRIYTGRLHPIEGKKMRAKMRRKIKYEGFTDLDQVWESVHSPVEEPVPACVACEPEPEEESPQQDP